LFVSKVVAMVKKEEWINSVSYTPMLRFSLLAPLLSEYFPDGVGISPATIRHSSTARKRVGKLVKKDVTQPGNNRGSAIAGHHVPATLLHPLHPFHHPHEGPRAQVSPTDPHFAEIP
jgi:hypothetical protein